MSLLFGVLPSIPASICIISMSTLGNDLKLLQAVFNRSFDAVMAALQAGASVNGSPEEHWPPIAAATMANEVSMVEYFLRRGADPNRPVKIEPPCPRWHAAVAVPGERDLHIAVGNGYNEIVRLLLKGSRADPKGTDNRGGPPLMASCENLNVSVEVVPLLLEAGADPAFASENGVLALHMVALHRNVEIINMLYSKAPATLNVCTSNGVTPLFLSCIEGHEGIVSKLLSLGAVQPMPLDANDKCLISVAVEKGFVGVVRVLINQEGIRAVGGGVALRYALCIAICYHQARILPLFLAAVDGKNGRSQWMNINLEGNHLLLFAAGSCNPVGVSISSRLVRTRRHVTRAVPLKVPSVWTLNGMGLGQEGRR